MSIDEAREQLSAYLDGELDAAERRAVDDALAASPELRAELDALRRTAELVHTMPRAAAPAGLADRVAAAIAADAAPTQPQARPGWVRTWRPALAAAACLLIGFVVLVATRPRSPRPAAITPPKEDAPVAAKALGTDKAAVPEAEARNGAPKALLADNDVAMAKGPVLKKAAPAPAEPSDRKFAAAPPRPSAKKEAAREPVHSAKLGMARRRPRAVTKAKPPARPAKPKPTADAFVAAPEVEAVEEAKSRLRRAANRDEQLERDAEPEDRPAPGGGNTGLIASILRERRPAWPKAQAPAQPSRGAHSGRAVVGAARAAGGAGVKQGEGLVREKEQGALAYSLGGARGREHRVEVAYADLHACLAAVQGALRDANVPFAIQPVGSGRFVVEATMPEAEAMALAARLAARPASRADVLAKRKDAPAPKAPPAASPVRGPVRLVQLMVHFRPARALRPPATRGETER